MSEEQYRNGSCRKDRLYGVWSGMISRCTNHKRHNASSYAAKGITVCEEWKGKEGFFAFKKWSLDNGYDYEAPKGKCTIDRIDNSKGYFPANCRWVDTAVQANNKTTNHFIEYNGEIHTLSEWAKILGINVKTLESRVSLRKWPIEKAFVQPVRNLEDSYLNIEFMGIRHNLCEWGKILGINDTTLYRNAKAKGAKETIEYLYKKGQRKCQNRKLIPD